MRRFAVRFTALSVLAVLAAAAAPSMAEADSCAGADRAPSRLGPRGTAHATLCLLNRERSARGVRTLRLDGKLARAARGHAGDMVARRYFAHDSISGATLVTRIKRTGWTRARRSWTVGENIGYGSGVYATPRQMVRGWMNSRGHRSNILSRSFAEIGIGVADGAPTGDAGATYTTDFGG